MNRKEEIKKMIRRVIDEQLKNINYKLFIFGSQSNKENLIKADIDIGIEAERILTDKEESIIYNMLEDLPTLYKFDFVDFKKTENSFNKIALQNTELI